MCSEKKQKLSKQCHSIGKNTPAGSYSSNSKRYSEQMAAMKAMEYFNGLSNDNSTATFASHSAFPAVSKKGDEEKPSLGTNDVKDNTTSEISFTDTSAFSAKLPSGVTELPQQISSLETAKPPIITTESDNPDRKLMSTPKTNYKSALQEHLKKKKLGLAVYVSTPDPTTNKYVSKVFVGKTYHAKSKLNEYVQKRRANPPHYETVSDNSKGFRSKVTVLGKTFDCVRSYSTRKTSTQMAAMEALDYFNSLSVDNSATRSVPHSVFPLGFKKNDEDNESPRTSEKEDNMPSAISSSVWTPKTQLNHKSSLHEYLHKSKLGQAVYESTKDPTTNTYSSKIFVRNRCFKGNDQKSKKEAEKHVAEVALRILGGRGRTPDCNFQKVLKEYHTNIGFPTFPKYKEASCVDDGRFIVEVKVKKKYQFVCENAKSRKKDVEVWLAEQAVKVLEREKKISPVEGNAKSRLNVFLQSQGEASKYDIQGDQAKFTGSLLFYAVDIYESLAPQKTKEEANIFAAMSACNGMDLL